MALSLPISGCRAIEHPPALPANQVTDLPYLWPVEQKKESLPEPSEKIRKGGGEVGLDNGIIAVVNDRIITMKEFAFYFFQQVQRGGKQASAELYNEILDTMIDRELMLTEAIRRDASLSEEELKMVNQGMDDELKSRFENIVNRSGGYDQLVQQLEMDGQSVEDLKSQLREGIRIQKTEAEFMQGTISVSPEEVRQAYERNLSDYQEPEMRDISLILLFEDQYKSPEMARQQLDNIVQSIQEAKTDFAEMARQHSHGPKAKEGGHYGWIRRQGDLSPEISAIAFSLPAGRMSGVESMPGTVFVVKVNEAKDAKTLSLNDVRKDLQNHLQLQKRADVLESVMKRLRQPAHIEKLPPADFLRSIGAVK